LAKCSGCGVGDPESIHLNEKSAPRTDETNAAAKLRFYADLVVHGSANPLLAAETAFSCLHEHVPEKELDLIHSPPDAWHSLAHERLRS
jgi:hypothetical protein